MHRPPTRATGGHPPFRARCMKAPQPSRTWPQPSRIWPHTHPAAHALGRNLHAPPPSVGRMGVSDAAMERATGRSRPQWHAALDQYGLDIDHTERVRRLAADHPDLSSWWCQSVAVDFEQARGLRVKGQSSSGDFQVSCSKTVDGDPDAVWQRLVTAPLLPTADWREGAVWDAGEARVEVRRVDPGKILRWFWVVEGGKSTVEVSFQPKGGATTVVFRHHGLDSAEAVERYRKQWKAALEKVA